jgi:hypothetical protein
MRYQNWTTTGWRSRCSLDCYEVVRKKFVPTRTLKTIVPRYFSILARRVARRNVALLKWSTDDEFGLKHRWCRVAPSSVMSPILSRSELSCWWPSSTVQVLVRYHVDSEVSMPAVRKPSQVGFDVVFSFCWMKSSVATSEPGSVDWSGSSEG